MTCVATLVLIQSFEADNFPMVILKLVGYIVFYDKLGNERL